MAFLALGYRDTNEKIKAFKAKYGHTDNWQMGANDNVADSYGVEAFPTTFVLDKRGGIQLRQVGVPSAPVAFYGAEIERLRKK